MNVSILSVNGSNIPLLDQPEGLADTSIVYERDEFSGMIIKLDIDLIFRCGSGKEAIDEEYNNRFVDGLGYIVLTDICNGDDIQFEFQLDFSKYRYNSSTTTIGLKEYNPLHDWKDNLDNEIEIPSGNYEVAYIRNIPMEYNYYSEKWTSAERLQTGNVVSYNELYFLTSWFDTFDKLVYMFPKSYTTLNELEDGVELTSETIGYTDLGLCSYRNLLYNDPSGAFTTPTSYKFICTEVEPQAVFENTLEDGSMTITTTGSTDLLMNFSGSVRDARFQITEWRECIAIGAKFLTAKKGVFNVLNDTPTLVSSSPIASLSLTNPTYPTKTFSETYEVKKGESVWIWYEIVQTYYPDPLISPTTGEYSFRFNQYDIEINRDLTIVYNTAQNTTTADLTTNQDLIDWSTEIKCFSGATILNELCPSLTYSLFNTDCYSELHFANGEYMRNKINKKEFKIKPRFFFEELDKIIGCGVGVFYDISGTPTLENRPIEDFYSPFLGLIITNEFDDVKIDIDEQRLYNKLEIGYSNFKDTTEETCRKNDYNITEQKKGKSVWSRVSDFIASKYLVKRALRLPTDDKELEFDKNIFLLSLRNINTYHLHSASQSSNPAALGFDDITEANTAQDFGMNRKYSSIFNLVRNKMRWAFGFFNSKDLMENTSLSLKEITHGNTLPSCGINQTFLANKSTLYTDVDGSYSQIPIFIYCAKLMTLSEFLDFRKFWYNTVVVEKDGINYYGNVLKVEYKKGVARFKLTGNNQ